MPQYRLWILLSLTLAAALAWRFTHRPAQDMEAPAFKGPYREQTQPPAPKDSFTYVRSKEHVKVHSRDLLTDLPPDIKREFHLNKQSDLKKFHPTPFVQAMFDALPPEPPTIKVKGKPQLIPQTTPEGEPLAGATTPQTRAPAAH